MHLVLYILRVGPQYKHNDPGRLKLGIGVHTRLILIHHSMRSAGSGSETAVLAMPNDKKRTRSFADTYTNLFLDLAPAPEVTMVATWSLILEVTGSNPGKSREERSVMANIACPTSSVVGVQVRVRAFTLGTCQWSFRGCLGRISLSGAPPWVHRLRPLTTVPPSNGDWLGPSVRTCHTSLTSNMVRLTGEFPLVQVSFATFSLHSMDRH